ncbi:unnamed protein product [Pleuronectes platessa]|uniref:Uncharacterized protein n=1 Tax=Pleuronectes platessa TaxID=8262 RepID=A0A9N7TVG8_PLEPL|nr:unnamed protein product [Pleuronectes platessa]
MNDENSVIVEAEDAHEGEEFIEKSAGHTGVAPPASHTRNEEQGKLESHCTTPEFQTRSLGRAESRAKSRGEERGETERQRSRRTSSSSKLTLEANRRRAREVVINEISQLKKGDRDREEREEEKRGAWTWKRETHHLIEDAVSLLAAWQALPSASVQHASDNFISQTRPSEATLLCSSLPATGSSHCYG